MMSSKLKYVGVAMVLAMVALPLAGAQPMHPTEYPITGYVYNNSNAALPGITVDLYNGATLVQTCTSDLTGYWGFVVTTIASYVVVAHAAGYWTERMNVTIGYPSWQFSGNFKLPNDITTDSQVMVSMFCNVNWNNWQMTMSFDMSSQTSTKVYAMAGGSGMDFTSTFATDTEYTETQCISLVYVRNMDITGWFWSTQSGKCMNCYVAQAYTAFYPHTTVADPKRGSDFSSKSVWGVNSGNSMRQDVTGSGTWNVNAGMDMSVGVDLLGISWGTTLSSGITQTGLTAGMMEWTAHNISGGSHTLYVVYDSNVCVHIWDESTVNN